MTGARPGRGGGGGGGGRAAVDEGNRDFQVSRSLSWILRHGAEKEGLALDGEGFARCDELLQWQKLKSLRVSFPEIQRTVSTNAKQRFSLKPVPSHDQPNPEDPSHWLIRANQGHSIAMSSAALLTPITLAANNIPEVVVHGTYYRIYPTILASGGLKTMGRNHIHFSTGLPEDPAGVISGMRSDAQILIYVDVKACLEDAARRPDEGARGQEILWWRSENGVVLTEGDGEGMLGTRWWKKVVARDEHVGVLWEDGKEVTALPVALQAMHMPNGKRVRRVAGERRGGGGRGWGAGKALVGQSAGLLGEGRF